MKRQQLRGVVAGMALSLLLSACGSPSAPTYTSVAQAFNASRSAAAVADRELHAEAAHLTLGSIVPDVIASDRCFATPQTEFGGHDGVTCTKTVQVIYRDSASSPAELWAAEVAGLNKAATSLSKDGWTVPLGPHAQTQQLISSLADPGYDPYPIDIVTPEKAPTYMWLDLLDNSSHRGSGDDPLKSQLPTSQPGAFLMAFEIQDTYVTGPCPGCYSQSSNVWPSGSQDPIFGF